MRCRFFIFFILLANTAQTQTHKIDSIRKNLPVLNDREAVNSLNALGCQTDEKGVAFYNTMVLRKQ